MFHFRSILALTVLLVACSPTAQPRDATGPTPPAPTVAVASVSLTDSSCSSSVNCVYTVAIRFTNPDNTPLAVNAILMNQSSMQTEFNSSVTGPIWVVWDNPIYTEYHGQRALWKWHRYTVGQSVVVCARVAVDATDRGFVDSSNGSCKTVNR